MYVVNLHPAELSITPSSHCPQGGLTLNSIAVAGVRSSDSSDAKPPHHGFAMLDEYTPGCPRSAFLWHVDTQNHPYFKAQRLQLHTPQRMIRQAAHQDTGGLVKKNGSRPQVVCHASASGPPAQPFVSQSRHKLQNEPTALSACNNTQNHQEISVQESSVSPGPEKVCKLNSQSQQHCTLAVLTACQPPQVDVW